MWWAHVGRYVYSELGSLCSFLLKLQAKTTKTLKVWGKVISTSAKTASIHRDSQIKGHLKLSTINDHRLNNGKVWLTTWLTPKDSSSLRFRSWSIEHVRCDSRLAIVLQLALEGDGYPIQRKILCIKPPNVLSVPSWNATWVNKDSRRKVGLRAEELPVSFGLWIQFSFWSWYLRTGFWRPEFLLQSFPFCSGLVCQEKCRKEMNHLLTILGAVLIRCVSNTMAPVRKCSYKSTKATTVILNHTGINPGVLAKAKAKTDHVLITEFVTGSVSVLLFTTAKIK